MVSNTQDIRIENYDYALPDERIAKYPLAERDQSKLLVYREGKADRAHVKRDGGFGKNARIDRGDVRSDGDCDLRGRGKKATRCGHLRTVRFYVPQREHKEKRAPAARILTGKFNRTNFPERY